MPDGSDYSAKFAADKVIHCSALQPKSGVTFKEVPILSLLVSAVDNSRIMMMTALIREIFRHKLVNIMP